MLHRITSYIVIIFAIIFTAVLPAHAARADAQDFTITDFQADYYVSRDQSSISTLRAEELITAEFPTTNQNHGILRAIPHSTPEHGLELAIQKVALQGKEVPYTTYDENGHTVLKIGNPDTYVHGKNTYAISYTMRGVDTFTYGSQQFYWNVNGTQWQQPFGKVEARIHLDEGLSKAVHDDQLICYTGAQGSSVSDCNIKTVQNGSQKIITMSTKAPLPAQHTLSVVVPFPIGTFADYQPSMGEIIKWVSIIAALVVPPVVALLYMLLRWRRYGKDPKGRGVTVPEYVPPKNVTVMQAGIVLKEGFDPTAITAFVVDLAVRHYVRIYEVTAEQFIGSKTEYELELVRLPESFSPTEKEMLEHIFSTPLMPGAKIAMSSLQKNRAYVSLQKSGSALIKQVASEGYFASEPNKAKMPYIIVGIIVLLASLFILPLGFGCIAAGIILIVGAQFMPVRTKKGVALHDYLRGLRMYMKMAEADRLKVLQSPRGDLIQKIDINDTTKLVKLYENLLPYAILFGIEKQWAEALADLYGGPPDWYSGSSAFTVAHFAHSVHSFGEASKASFTSPSSSSGGAGGGAGGGGGGGW